jgi:hypothetical protein
LYKLQRLLQLANEPERPEAVVRDVLDYVCVTAKRQEIFFRWRPTLVDPSDDMIKAAEGYFARAAV